MMAKAIDYQPGDVLNGLIFLRETSPHMCASRKKTRKATFRCSCGKEFDVIIRSVISGNTKSCGCYKSKSQSERFGKHHLRNHPIYRIWGSIKTRCYNQKRADYKYYGGSGVQVSDEFRNDFKSFFDYVTSLSGYEDREIEKLTLDRINNNGNYERGNLRWATMKEQCNNRRNNVAA